MTLATEATQTVCAVPKMLPIWMQNHGGLCNFVKRDTFRVKHVRSGCGSTGGWLGRLDPLPTRQHTANKLEVWKGVAVQAEH